MAYRLVSNMRFLWKWKLMYVLGPLLCFPLGLAFCHLVSGVIPQLLDPVHVVTAPGQWYMGILVFYISLSLKH